MKDNSKMTNKMDLGELYMGMHFMQDNLNMVGDMDKVNVYLMMEQFFKAGGNKILLNNEFISIFI
jgi:hypothetical protein